MNVLLISECTKNALTETRRILDQFAERRGERTWQTAITQQGLETLHRLLRKSARKNTAVSCHWIRGRDHSELIWIVGDARRFNATGATPTNTTGLDVLRRGDENDWHNAETIRLLAALAALFHDIGKANKAFQRKLMRRQAVADAHRHEWVSLRLFQAFVGNDDDVLWLRRLCDLPTTKGEDWLAGLVRDGQDEKATAPLRTLPPLAQIIGWLILTHHRLPANPEFRAGLKQAHLLAIEQYISAQWCGSRPKRDGGGGRSLTSPNDLPAEELWADGPPVGATQEQIDDCWSFRKPKDLPMASRHWRERVARVARDLLARQTLSGADWLNDPYVLHLARLALMLADHYYSSLPSNPRYGDGKCPLYANTERTTGALKQRLDEHLIGVEVNARRLVRSLPLLERQMARIARHKGFRQPASQERFRWQNRAFDLAVSLQPKAARQGFFGVNMASTGYGKTLANGRILYGLAHPQQGARFCIALGLRTLTLQTGDAYRDRLHLGSEDMAVLVGGGAIRALHEYQREEQTGSASAAALLPEQTWVHYEGSLEDGPLNRWLENSPDAQRLLAAPVLICTIDHLMPATEGTRGGHQIAPLLRLMTSDLVLDEPDDFDLADLPALTRLVHWAGLFGSRVLLSSATLPPALVTGLFEAYRAGREHYQRNRGEPGLPVNICCAWFDEFLPSATPHDNAEGFAATHEDFVERRLALLARAERRRRAVIQPLPIKTGQPREAICAELAAQLREHVGALHACHAVSDPATGKRISVGLIRMANIDPLVLTAQALYELGAAVDQRIHLCVYHARHPLLIRAAIERRLDRLLNRTHGRQPYDDEEMLGWLRVYPEADQIFVVLATAVAEVGRDHDYDWAIVEPSSMRSIIQLAGRVRRHREGSCESPNLYLLDTNVRHLAEPRGPAYLKPGFEDTDFPLDQHLLSDLLTPEQIERIDAAPRIRAREPLRPRGNLVDLEHARLRALMLGDHGEGQQKVNPVDLWWTTRAPLTGELQRRSPFRFDPEGRQRFLLLPDEDGGIDFRRCERDGTTTSQNQLMHTLTPGPGPRIGFWGAADYGAELESLAERLGMETDDCARRFGSVELPARGTEQGWDYHPALGFSRRR
ncbi:type I-F CRISPR-associated helicase Cas3f [Thiohalocapsa marina]|uniref:type I-F CRISPR-associated helicase Cas3f n=1 Tax=Thiohalocapsa marina TaxID=424902 RepID=UPI0036DD0158